MGGAIQPVAVQKIGDELAIAWSDGGESYFKLEQLRKACPCATCQGEPDAMGVVVRPRNEHSAESFDLTGWQFVGGYGLQPRWADGHQTGIYSYSYLRELGKGA